MGKENIQAQMQVIQFRGTVYENGYGQVAQRVMRDKTIERDAKALYAYLCSFAGVSAVLEDERYAYPTIKTIMEELGFKSDKTFYKYRKQLIDAGYITIEQKKEHGKFDRNIYYIEAVIKDRSNNPQNPQDDPEQSFPFYNWLEPDKNDPKGK
jgi:hypothetical protein